MTRQLPAGTCIRHAIDSVRNNLAYAFRISWPWYLFVIPLIIVLNLLLSYAAGGNLAEAPGLSAMNSLISGLLMGFAFASIAVNWHRYILLDEVPDASGILRVDDKVWRYFGNMLLIFVILVAAGTVIGIPLGIIGGIALANALDYFPIFLLIVMLPLILMLALRLSVKLPAIALGRGDFGLKDAMSVTRGNFLPIFLVALFEVALFLGALLLIGAVSYALHPLSPTLAMAVAFALQFATNWIITIFSITVLTSLYGFFVEGRDF